MENTETKKTYIEPNIDWLKKQFEHVKIGSIKPSEIEIILAYMLMYHNKDLDGLNYDIADKYGYTETRINKLQIEFAKRFLIDDWHGLLGVLAKKIFVEKSIELAKEENGDIAFSITNAAEHRALKRALDEKSLIRRGDFTSSYVRISSYAFAIVFSEFNEKLAKNLKGYVKKKDKALSEELESLSLKKAKKVGVDLLKFLASNSIGIANIVFACL